MTTTEVQYEGESFLVLADETPPTEITYGWLRDAVERAHGESCRAYRLAREEVVAGGNDYRAYSIAANRLAETYESFRRVYSK
jgi:hypothetical protein